MVCTVTPALRRNRNGPQGFVRTSQRVAVLRARAGADAGESAHAGQ
ncbi:hypothetical protein L839_2475 [Mycobacterium avium MAV_120809_2495]|nr:hypothetical protein L839_2475 [Mycobacterium avium MAV_120809_2495]